MPLELSKLPPTWGPCLFGMLLFLSPTQARLFFELAAGAVVEGELHKRKDLPWNALWSHWPSRGAQNIWLPEKTFVAPPSRRTTLWTQDSCVRKGQSTSRVMQWGPDTRGAFLFNGSVKCIKEEASSLWRASRSDYLGGFKVHSE